MPRDFHFTVNLSRTERRKASLTLSFDSDITEEAEHIVLKNTLVSSMESFSTERALPNFRFGLKQLPKYKVSAIINEMYFINFISAQTSLSGNENKPSKTNSLLVGWLVLPASLAIFIACNKLKTIKELIKSLYKVSKICFR